MTRIGGSRYKQLLTLLRKKIIGAFETKVTLSYLRRTRFGRSCGPVVRQTTG